MLKELQDSIPVKTANLVNVKNAALLAMTLASANVQADTFYNDYATQELAQYVDNRVSAISRFEEVKIRENLGCKTGDLREELGGILRHVNVKGHKLDITEDNYAQNVDDLVTSAEYEKTGICGDKPTIEVAEIKEDPSHSEDRNFELPNKVRNLDIAKETRDFELPKEVRDSNLIKPKTRKGFKI